MLGWRIHPSERRIPTCEVAGWQVQLKQMDIGYNRFCLILSHTKNNRMYPTLLCVTKFHPVVWKVIMKSSLGVSWLTIRILKIFFYASSAQHPSWCASAVTKIISFEFWGTIPRTDSLACDEPFTHSETKAKMQQHLPCRFCLQLIGSIWAI